MTAGCILNSLKLGQLHINYNQINEIMLPKCSNYLNIGWSNEKFTKIAAETLKDLVNILFKLA